MPFPFKGDLDDQDSCSDLTRSLPANEGNTNKQQMIIAMGGCELSLVNLCIRLPQVLSDA